MSRGRGDRAIAESVIEPEGTFHVLPAFLIEKQNGFPACIPNDVDFVFLFAPDTEGVFDSLEQRLARHSLA